jgi:hypothetical protein
MKESLVEVSPSTVMQLNDSSAASRSSCCSSAAAMPASVAMKPSMVAMFGRIMPAPLLMPVMVMRPAVDLEAPRGGFGDRVGGHDGVRGACQWSARRSAIQAGRPAIRRSTGKRFEDHAGREGQHLAVIDSQQLAEGGAGFGRRLQPCSPVPALATPVLMTSARMSLPSSRWRRQTCTGAAQKRLLVNTPATRQPGSRASTVRSCRSGLRMAAAATPRRTPATGQSSVGGGGTIIDGHCNLANGVGQRQCGGKRRLRLRQRALRRRCHVGVILQLGSVGSGAYDNLPWQCFVLLARAAGAGVVAADFWPGLQRFHGCCRPVP